VCERERKEYTEIPMKISWKFIVLKGAESPCNSSKARLFYGSRVASSFREYQKGEQEREREKSIVNVKIQGLFEWLLYIHIYMVGKRDIKQIVD
jgi:hypothetical protein